MLRISNVNQLRLMFIGFYFLSCSFLYAGNSPEKQSALIEQLTFGDGNDIEAAWSLDGNFIAFQSDRGGRYGIEILNLSNRERKEITHGNGHACYPAWVPDGGILFSYGEHEGTAVQAARKESIAGYGLCLWEKGQVKKLTQGYWRDYTPSIDRQGKNIYFSSTKGVGELKEIGVWKSQSRLWRLSLSSHSEPECLFPLYEDGNAAVQPSVSPDGKLLLWTFLKNCRENWVLALSRLDQPGIFVHLTSSIKMSAYAPRWSPNGRFIAFTGFRSGDPGWGVYVMEVMSRRMIRLPTGDGNSRNPAWNPNGRFLVYENNHSGSYKLYRIPVNFDQIFPNEKAKSSIQFPVVKLVQNGKNFFLEDSNQHSVKGISSSPTSLVFQNVPEINFGTKAFFIRTKLVVDRIEKGIQVAAVGRYVEHALGWQILVRDNGKLSFAVRSGEGKYLAAETVEPIPLRKELDVLCIRNSEGEIWLFLDGIFQHRVPYATFSYDHAQTVALGQQWNGGMRLNGKVLSFSCGRFAYCDETHLPLLNDK